MPTTLTTNEETKLSAGGGGGFDTFAGFGGSGGPPEPERTPPPEGYRLAVWLVLASVTMMFMALASAFVALEAKAVVIAVPRVLWLSTVVILACSVTIERGRRALKRRDERAFKQWLYATMALGLVFLASQVAVLLQLKASGFFLTANKRSWFAWMLTALHGIHLCGGLAALAFVLSGNRRGVWTAVRRRFVVDAATLYWHFLAGLWIFLFALLFFWR